MSKIGLKTFLIGVSGPSSAGKSTLAYLLSSVFGPYFQHVLHGDDFCRDISVLPTFNDYPDADGPDGIDSEKMIKTLDYLKVSEGKLPDEFESWQADVYPDEQLKALQTVPDINLKPLREKVSTQFKNLRFRLVIVEGFLLYHQPDIRSRLDGRLFVRLNHDEARYRRMNRPGHESNAKEGEFWKTEDYFETMVWRNYVEQHKDLFEGGDVEGKVNEEICREREIVMQEDMNVQVEDTLVWAVDALIRMLREKMMMKKGED